MSFLHPQWHTTDDEDQHVRITDADVKVVKEVRTSIKVPRAKRSPAAIVGIALFLGIGFAAFQGITGLTGQVSQADIEITLGNDGPSPAVVTAAPGQTISWKNQSSIPHILLSVLLPTEDGKGFQTTAILPNGYFEYTVPAEAIEGTFEYTSETSPTFKGQIVINALAALEVKEVAPAVPTPEKNEAPTAATTMEGVFTQLEEASTATSTEAFDELVQAKIQSETTNAIPQNSHTIANADVTHASAIMKQQVRPAAPIQDHTPVTNTETGMETFWAVLGLSFGALFLITRKQFA